MLSNAENKHFQIVTFRTRFALCDQRLMTKGVRIRASPALNSSQIGIIPRGTTVSYIEEVENADGVWLRLTDEACAMYCDTQLPSQVCIREVVWKANNIGCSC